MKKLITELKGKEGGRSFLRILKTDGTTTSGGNQLWFKDTADERGVPRTDFGSCGVIAAANLLSYLERREYKDISRCTFLPAGAYRQDGAIHQKAYMQLATALYDEYMTPWDTNKLGVLNIFDRRLSADSAVGLFLSAKRRLSRKEEAAAQKKDYYSLGIWPISKLEKGICDYAYEKGVLLRPMGIGNSDSQKSRALKRACKFIRQSLAEDIPVLMLVTHNKSARKPGKSTDRHYMLITRITETYEPIEKGGKKKYRLVDAQITVASWGKESEISLSELWQDSVFARIGKRAKKMPGLKTVGTQINQKVNSVYLTSFR